MILLHVLWFPSILIYMFNYLTNTRVILMNIHFFLKHYLQTEHPKIMNECSKKLSEAIGFVDRISDLPDSVLCYILSFPPTKQAVVTSILSRRWEFLWTYVDILEFDNYIQSHQNIEVPEKMQFVQFVNRVLQLHRAPAIKRMRLRTNGSGCNQYDVVTWLRTAVSRSVQSLDLYIRFDYKWPLCLFYSQTLVELTLNYADIANINIPTAPFFPNLKKLHLKFPNLNPPLERFISGCSVLECFFFESKPAIRSCHYISSSTLKKICYHCRGFGEQKLLLNTPALEFIKIWNIRNFEVFVKSSMPSLREAHIPFDLKVTDKICPLKPNLHEHFHNLAKLEIMVPVIGLHLVTNFMEKSNNLHVITLKHIEIGGKNEAIWEEPKCVPKCLMSSLHTICIQGYANEEVVELMIKYVLANAKVLKRMEIRTSDSIKNYELKFRMVQKITMFPRASGICEISFF